MNNNNRITIYIACIHDDSVNLETIATSYIYSIARNICKNLFQIGVAGSKSFCIIVDLNFVVVKADYQLNSYQPHYYWTSFKPNFYDGHFQNLLEPATPCIVHHVAFWTIIYSLHHYTVMHMYVVVILFTSHESLVGVMTAKINTD